MTSSLAARRDYRVADLSLAPFGRKEIHLAEHEMPGLRALRKEFGPSKPLQGARISGSLHMTIQTAVLIETLVELGAEVRWASCKSSRPGSRAAEVRSAGRHGRRDKGVPVVAWKARTWRVWVLEQMMTWPAGQGTARAEHDLDDGGDATLDHKAAESRRRRVPDPTSAPNPEFAIVRVCETIVEDRSQEWTRQSDRGVQRRPPPASCVSARCTAWRVASRRAKSTTRDKEQVRQLLGRHSIVDAIAGARSCRWQSCRGRGMGMWERAEPALKGKVAASSSRGRPSWPRPDGGLPVTTPMRWSRCRHLRVTPATTHHHGRPHAPMKHNAIVCNTPLEASRSRVSS